VDIVTNNFQTSHHELRRLGTKMALLKNFTHRFGGAYVYANHVGGDGNGKLYFDGSSR
jgi:NAD+ synthase (glutamine-hydrolysing)